MGGKIKARKVLKNELKSNQIVCLQDTRIVRNDVHKYKMVKNWARENVLTHPRCFHTTVEKGKAGGTMILLPEKILKIILTVDAISSNTMYVVFESMNTNINLIINHYGKPGTKKEDFLEEIRNINKIIRGVRQKYKYATVICAGDFNVRTTSTRYPLLLHEMSKSGISPAFDEKTYTWFPQRLQSLSKKPTKIDYIFTSEELLNISDGERISADLLYSDHCLLKIHGKTGKQSSKTKRFPDAILDSEKGRLQVEKYLKLAVSNILKHNCQETTIPKIEDELINSGKDPEGIIKKITSYIVKRAQDDHK